MIGIPCFKNALTYISLQIKNTYCMNMYTVPSRCNITKYTQRTREYTQKHTHMASRVPMHVFVTLHVDGTIHDFVVGL